MEYYSASQGSWIPAKAVHQDARGVSGYSSEQLESSVQVVAVNAKETYDLDCRLASTHVVCKDFEASCQ